MPRRDQQQSCRASKGPRRPVIHLAQNRNPARVLPPKNGIRFHGKSIPHLQNFCCVLFAALLRSLRIEGATRHQATALTRRQPNAPTRGSCGLDSGFGHPSANPHLHWASLGNGTNHIIGCVCSHGLRGYSLAHCCKGHRFRPFLRLQRDDGRPRCICFRCVRIRRLASPASRSPSCHPTDLEHFESKRCRLA